MWYIYFLELPKVWSPRFILDEPNTPHSSKINLGLLLAGWDLQELNDSQFLLTGINQMMTNKGEAAMLLLNDYEIEPTRSVLFRSAACLALDFDDYREAERMIAFGLSGNPPLEILEELRELLISHIPIRPTKPVSISLKQRRLLPVSPPVAVGVG